MKKKIFLVAMMAAVALSSCTTVDSGSVGIKFHKWAADKERQTSDLYRWANSFNQY